MRRTPAPAPMNLGPCVDGDPRCVGPVYPSRGFMCRECDSALHDAAAERAER